MVDREARNQFAASIRALVAGLISNIEYESNALSALDTADPAIKAIHRRGVWCLYSDLHEHRLIGRLALRKHEKSHVARWILFLKTDLPYTWPEIRDLQFVALVLANFITLGFANRVYAKWFKRHGDVDVWPFASREDLAIALQKPAYLGVATKGAFKTDSFTAN